ncbi:unnamed protein product [Tilletia laevis]|uniref:18S rRNA factor 2 n=2 Tax=Tilletia TaxID=13289 RepID=A0A177UZQ5_9BASI|nr:hypothetical protein CF336_g2076 [Tilletia laevis]KAE8263522.1 hypothetical protein A4X03_0g1621 [Tilletia caries]CAD6950236.1 unnamed protein product [Tilletia controversa]KAE8207087.1 hypothetical protein CF335_g1406 [Tilletia laevis]CAD6885538.1 unnamed protein product [Tilletia caries]
MAATDSRFDTSEWKAAGSASAVSAPVVDAPGEQVHSDGEHDVDEDEVDDDENDGDEDGDEDDGDDDEDGDEEEEEKVVKPLSKSELEAYQRKQRKAGIIYISSIPHGMTPPKVRHLLSGFGELERIYLHDGTQGKFGSSSSDSKRRSSAHYTEGWVEFARKSVAKQVAEVLNAKPIGTALIAAGVKMPRGSGGGGSSSKNAGGARRWKDHVWTMKYLPGFKWTMLTEQMAAERASRTARLRTELAQSALEQRDYLQKVERARVMNDKETRRQRRQQASSSSSTSQALPSQKDAMDDAAMARDGARMRTFKQRAPVLTDVRDQDRKERVAQQSSSEPQRQQQKRKADSDGMGANAGGKKKRKQEGGEGGGRGREALDSVLGSIF